MAKLTLAAILSFGSLCYAGIPVDGGRDVNSSYVNHLNKWFPKLDVTILSGADANAVFRELQLLENSVRGEIKLSPGELQRLCCSRLECQ
jgi:hypothetical protein